VFEYEIFNLISTIGCFNVVICQILRWKNRDSRWIWAFYWKIYNCNYKKCYDYVV